MKCSKRWVWVLFLLMVSTFVCNGIPRSALAEDLYPVTILATGLSTPRGLTVDSSGNIYVAEYDGNGIKKFNSSGTLIDTFANSDILHPTDVAVSSAGTIYYANTYGLWSMNADGSNQNLFVYGDHNIAYATSLVLDGNYVRFSARYILETPYKGYIFHWNLGANRMEGMSFGLDDPQGLTMYNGNLYVAERGKNRVLNDNTSGTLATGFNYPTDIAADSRGNFYVADTFNNCVKKISSDGVVTTIASGFSSPFGIAVDGGGTNVYVSDTTNNCIKKISVPGPATQLVWQTQPGGSTGGSMLTAQPVLVLKDLSGNTILDDNSTTVSLALANANGATLGGTTTVRLVNGVASFTNLSIDKAGTYTLQPSCSLGGVTTLPNSAPITVTVGPGKQLTWQTQPGGVVSGANLSPQPKLVLQDAGGNVVNDNTSTVSLVLNNANGAILSGTTTATLSGGVATFSNLYIAKAGTYTLQPYCSLAGVNILPASGAFTISAGPANASRALISSSKGTVAANGTDSATITVTIRDANDNPVSGKTVTLSQGSGLSSITTVNGTTASGGTATFAVKSTKAESVTYTATNMTDGMAIPQSATVVFAAGEVDATRSAVSADKPSLAANGTDTAAITVTLKDAYGNPVSGKTVTLAQGGKNSVISPVSAVSAADGTATFTVKSTKAEAVTYTAIGNGVTISQAAQVMFTPGALERLGVNVDAAQTAGAPFAVTVTAQDHYGNTIPDYTGTIHLSTDNGDSPRGDAPVLPGDYTFTGTDAGIHTFTGGVTLFHAITTTLTATDTVNSAITGASAAITVSPKPVNAAQSTVTAAKSDVTADNTDSTVITVALKDMYSNPVSGKSVMLSQGSGGSVITPANGTSGADGTVLFAVKSKKAEAVTYTATDTTDSLALTQTALVTFGFGTVEKLLVMGGTAQTAGEPFTVTVTAQDRYGNTVTGYTGTVHFSTTNGNSPGGDAPALPGDYTFSALDAGTHIFTGGVTLFNAVNSTVIATDTTDGSITGTTENITVSAKHADADHSNISADKSAVAADNTDSTVVRVALKDMYDNPVPGKSVSLAQGSGGSAITVISGTSGTDGAATFAVKSTKAEEVTYTAKDATDNVTLNQTANVRFLPGVPKSLAVNVGGAQTAGNPFTMTVTIQDQYGNTVTGYTGTVRFSTTNGNSPGGDAPVLPDAYTFTALDTGVHTFTGGITLFHAVTSAVSAADTGDGSITGTTADIIVSPKPVDAGYSTITAGKTTVMADNVDSTVITVALKDGYGNPVPGKSVSLTQGIGSSSITVISDTTGADGAASFAVKSTKAEDVIYTADTADGETLHETADVRFLPGAPKSLAVSAAGAQTAGVPFAITVTVQDQHGNTVKNYGGTVHFSTTNGDSPQGDAPVLPADYAFTALDAGAHTFTGGITLFHAVTSAVTAADTADSSIVGTTADITVSPKPVDAGYSTITAGKTTVTADNTDSTVITVALKDSYDNPVPNKSVSLAQGSASSTITVISDTTGTDGAASFAVKSTKAEDVTYTAADTTDGVNLSQTARLSFLPGVPESFKVSAGGTQTAGVPFSVTVTVQDQYGNTVKNYNGTVRFSTTNGDSPRGDAPALPENYTFAAPDAGVHTFNGGITLFNAKTSTVTAADTVDVSVAGTTDNITVSPKPVDATHSTVTAAKTTVTADNADSTDIAVVLKDIYDNPVSGKSVTLLQESGSSTITTVKGTSDALGVASFAVKSAKAKDVTYGAKDLTDGIALAQRVRLAFVPGPVDAMHSSVSADKTIVAANGINSAMLTVTLQDAHGNPISDQTVTLDQGGARSTVEALDVKSSSAGIFRFAVTDTRTESVTYHAVSNSVIIAQTVAVDFTQARTVDVAVIPSGGGTVTGTGIYGEGESVRLTAAPDLGYKFSGWFENNKLLDSRPVLTFTVGSANKHLTANFTSASASKGNTAPVSGSAGLPGSASTTANGIRVRADASGKGKTLGTLPKNATLTVLDVKGGYAQVNYQGQMGWVSLDYLSFRYKQPLQGVTVQKAVIRKGQSASAGRLGTIALGQEVKVLGREGKWLVVEYNGGTAYVAASSTTPLDFSRPVTGSLSGRYAIYASPGGKGAKIATLSKHTVVKITGFSNGWYKLDYNGTTAYIEARRMRVTP